MVATVSSQSSPQNKSISEYESFDKLRLLHKTAYADLPFEVVIKQDLLRLGIAFSKEAFISSDYKTKDYFIFSFDKIPLAEMQQGENWHAPEEIKFYGGESEFLPTVVSVRIAPQSPYRVGLHKNIPALFYNDVYIADVMYPPVPEYYKLDYNMEKPINEIAPVIEWGYLIYLTVFRHCQYFGKEEECMFCDINHNWRQQKKSGRPYTGVKSIEHILEAMAGIDKADSTAKAYTITGGSVVTQLQQKKEVEFYAQYAEAINKKFPRRWISKVVTQAFELDDCKRLKDADVQIYHPNYEVWDKLLFAKFCPGKERFVGRDNWIRRVVDSAKIFGSENVIPNFVGGVEMAEGHGFSDVDKAVASTLEGLDFFMSNGISPRFTTWCPEPYTALAESKIPPLEYYLKLLRGYKATHTKYNLPVPPGYGPAGVGKAVFSVSAFMDVLQKK